MSDQEIQELIQVRLQKVNDLRAKGIEPYGGRFERTNLAQEIKDEFESLEGKEVRVAGRLMAKRPWQGRVCQSSGPFRNIQYFT